MMLFRLFAFFADFPEAVCDAAKADNPDYYCNDDYFTAHFKASSKMLKESAMTRHEHVGNRISSFPWYMTSAKPATVILMNRLASLSSIIIGAKYVMGEGMSNG